MKGSGQWAVGSGEAKRPAYVKASADKSIGNRFPAAQGRLLVSKMTSYSPLTIHHDLVNSSTS
jgi:hypothetical protein